jgi:hypothetical protein
MMVTYASTIITNNAFSVETLVHYVIAVDIEY